MKTKAIMVLGTALLCICACREIPDLPQGTAVSGNKTVSLSIAGDRSLFSTRSSLSVSDCGLGHVDVLFYESGVLCPDLCISADPAWEERYVSSVSLPLGRSYEVIALANAGEISPPSSLEEALSSLVYVSEGLPGWNTLGIPMGCMLPLTVTPNLDGVSIELKRLVAKLDLSIDLSGLEHGSISFTSISVRQMNRICPFFRDGKASSSADVCDGDLASAEDLAGINNAGKGYSVSFYLMENRQGELLMSNTDPDRKTPESLSAAGTDPGLCTYLEVKGNYSGSSGQLTGEPLTARLYLGRNAYSDFDLERNCSYTVSLSITDDGCLRTDWKIDGNLDDRRELSFETASVRVTPGESETAVLSTNLSYAEGDYSYSVSGDVMCFDVSADDDATGFAVTAMPSAPDGACVIISASTWDGRHRTTHTATVRKEQSPGYSFYTLGGDVVYVAQTRRLVISDSATGQYPAGLVSVSSRNGCCTVRKLGPSNWYVEARSPGEELLELSVDGEAVADISILVVAPVLKFDYDEVLLPIDGFPVMCGPYYYMLDGSPMEYEDFESDLYEELLDVYIVRSTEPYMLGSYWRSGSGGGNPAVSLWDVGDYDYSRYEFALTRLSSNGYGLAENYDMTQSRVILERITGYPADECSGVAPATALLYTAEPFYPPEFMGSKESWALARWYEENVHDEYFTFSLDHIVRPGNRYSCAGAVYPFSEEGKYELSFLSSNTMRMKVLYGDNMETAMPEHFFTLCPVMANCHSGEFYRSQYNYEAEFTVNLAVGAVAEDNNAGGCNISVEWSFPRLDEGRLPYLEDHAVGSYCEGSGFRKGMYCRLYSVYGYDSDQVTSELSPDFGFFNLWWPAGTESLMPDSSYHVPTEYAAGYDLVLWKYEELFPDSYGWLRK